MHDPCPHCGSLEAPVIGRCADCGRLSGRRQQVHAHARTLSTPPQVILWFRIYWGLHALAVLGFAALFVFSLVAGDGSAFAEGFREGVRDGLDNNGPPERADDATLGMWIGVGITVAFTIPMIIAVFLPRRPWAWTYGIVMLWLGILISLGGCCLMIAATIPLIIYWSKPECKAWFKNPPISDVGIEDVFA